MAAIRIEPIIWPAATFSATVTSLAIQNDGRVVWELVVNTGALTTTPTLTPLVQASPDGITFFNVGAAITAISTQSLNRYIFALGSTQGPILEPFIKVTLTFGGSGSFASTSAVLYGIGLYD